MPALFAAIVLTINCCHSDRYALLLSGDSVASSGATQYGVNASAQGPASSQHCHSHRSATAGRSGHHEGADERPAEPSAPAAPDHETCPGCNPTPIVQDAQKTRLGPDDDKDSGAQPDLLTDLVQASHIALIEPASSTFPANHSRSIRTGAVSLYVINQSFLI
jgi:hypothetical protein